MLIETQFHCEFNIFCYFDLEFEFEFEAEYVYVYIDIMWRVNYCCCCGNVDDVESRFDEDGFGEYEEYES